MPIESEVIGATEVAFTFNRQAGRVGALANQIVRKSTLDTQRDGQAGTPVDTGALRESWRSNFQGDGRFSRVTGFTGPNMEYDVFVEEGTSRMAPQPYVRPAYERNAPIFERAMEKLAELEF